jgi:ubiquinone/menaquinone biosynthesis C-methylase UbiE
MRQMTPAEQVAAVAMNVRAYRKGWRKYDRRHSEIFNAIEQERLRSLLARAVGEIRSHREGPRRALDIGSGTGNVTRHLVELGLAVTACDVSPELLSVVRRRWPEVRTQLVWGIGLPEIESRSFDLVTVYSVLHHVPDYLGMVDEMVRVLRPGGVAFIDHEVSDEFWRKDGCLAEFHRAVEAELASRSGWWNPSRRPWQRYLDPRNLVLAAKLRYRPQMVFCVEGDIHTWESDHIEWVEVERRLRAAGAEVIAAEEYLVYREQYPHSVWLAHKDRCHDMRALVARR